MTNLYKIRTEKKMNQVALSVKLNVAQETISAYENGKAFPSVDTLLKLCDVFNVSADYLLDKTDVRTPVNQLVVDNFSKDELELLATFKKIPPSKRERALGLLIGLSE